MNKIEELINEYCPNGVEFVKLNEVCEIKRGTPLGEKDKIDGDIPVIVGAKEPSFFHNKSNREANTITIVGLGRGACGFVNFWNIPIFCSSCSFSIISKNQNVSTKFVYYVLKNQQEEIYKLRKGGAIPQLYPRDIEGFLIPLPPLAIQEKIVHILDSFSELISELISELKHRKMQYQYYLDNIFLCLKDPNNELCNKKFERH